MKIKLFGTVKEFLGKNEITIEIKEELTAGEVIKKLKIPEKYVFIIEKDGKPISKETKLNNNDTIVLVPFISGG